jgi:hydrogenase small subunit
MGDPKLYTRHAATPVGGSTPTHDLHVPRDLLERGVSRRTFLKFCAVMASVLALPPRYGPRIATALTQAPRIPVIWLNGQDCAGNTEGFLRAEQPTVAEMLLDRLSLDYHEVLMAPAGAGAEQSLADTMARYPQGYIAIVEGSIPLAEGGVYCTIGGRTFAEIAREVCLGALFSITAGSCAWDGGLPAAAGGVTTAVGLRQLVPGATVVNLPGCPMNVENLTATIVHYLTFGEPPAADGQGRPLFAYGDVVHNRCESLPHYNANRFVREWGDAGHRQGWCLFQMGCKGPSTLANCSSVRFNGERAGRSPPATIALAARRRISGIRWRRSTNVGAGAADSRGDALGPQLGTPESRLAHRPEGDADGGGSLTCGGRAARLRKPRWRRRREGGGARDRRSGSRHAGWGATGRRATVRGTR